MWHDFQHGRAAALELDALRHTHPIYCQVHTAEEANANFDLITYEKGASVVRMLERYLGPARFRRGVRAYIRRHREGNTVRGGPLARALRGLGRAGRGHGPRLDRAAGLPGGAHLAARARAAARSSRCAQSRFALRRAARPAAPPERWPIPWVGRLGSGAAGARASSASCWSRRASASISADSTPAFVYGNADEGGFFRPAHDPAELRALVSALPALSAVERMGLVDHQWALVRAGRAELDGPARARRGARATSAIPTCCSRCAVRSASSAAR